MLQVVFQHRHPAGNLLAERQRRGVLQVRTANLDDVAEGLRLLVERRLQDVKLGDKLLANGDYRRHVHRRREDVVRALAFVDVIVRVDLTFHAAHAAQQLARPVRQHFVHVHVALGAGTGLPDSEGKFVRMLARQHFVCGVDNGGGFVGVQQAQILVHFRGGAFSQRQRLNQRDGHFFGRNTEVLQRTLGLRAP